MPAAILLHAAWNFAGALVPPPSLGGQWLVLLMVTAVAVAVAMLWRRQ